MDPQPTAFLIAMAGVAVVALVGFLALLLAKSVDARHAAAPRWAAFALALALLVVAAVALVWQLAPLSGDGAEAITVTADAEADAEVAPEPEAEPEDWRQSGRANAFFTVMLVIAGLALVAFLVVLFTRVLRDDGAAPAASAAKAPAPVADIETPSAVRLLGLLALALGFLILNWAWLDRDTQYAVMVEMLYPAALAVALVLLIDKASRAWATKGTAETVREWLFCDAFTLLLVIAWLNLRQWQPGEDEAYAGMFWDVVAIALFFLAFWIVDRKRTRLRFLLAYLYVGLLPILLMIWRGVQTAAEEEEAVEAVLWWESLWPCFLLTVIFLVLEVILLIAARDTPRHGIAAAKDTVFVALYAVLLLVAIPEAAA